MESSFAGQPLWMMLSIVLILFLVLIIGGVTWSFDLRRSRLPEATQWDDLSQRLASVEVQLGEKSESLRALDQKIQDRDRTAAEVAALSEQRSALLAEIGGLAEAERQVEEMKHKAAEVMETYALEQGKLTDARNELGGVLGEIAAVRQTFADLEQKAEALRHELEQVRDTLPDDIKNLKNEIEQLKGDRRALDDEIAVMRGERAMLIAAREESAALSVRRAQLEQEVEALHEQAVSIRDGGALADFHRQRAELVKEIDGLRSARAQAEQLIEDVGGLAARKTAIEEDILGLRHEAARLDELRAEIERLGGQRDALIAMREEVAALSVRRAQLEQEVEALHEQAVSIRDGGALADFHRQRAELVKEIDGLRSARAQAEQLIEDVGGLAARKTAIEEDILGLRHEAARLDELRAEIERLGGQRDALIAMREEVAALSARKEVLERAIAGIDGKPDSDMGDDNVGDLAREPDCLRGAAVSSRAAQEENDALQEVAAYLKNLGLKYDLRTITAFHTALKINETSQMTVLAGVSGTGKSLLPRRYAEAMGIHFLQIAVEPRWDSPQDLLGFYNYIEKRYRGTELARALVHMDPFNTSGLAKKSFKDHVLLVLLDEMNLARVEYYFSEFLSRLEVRPRWSDAQDEAKRQGACLPIEIRGRETGPLKLFPSHNVLFAGTMNDDESTQALSDKVLDRSNVMQFAAPGEFALLTKTEDALRGADYRSFATWRTWIKSAGALNGGDLGTAQRVIKTLAGIMEGCGRPFGHRLNEAILTYIANYPRQKNDTLDDPLIDQIEFRILPKLRGLTIEEHQQHLDALVALVRDDLHDQRFADRLQALVERQRDGSGQFNWRGLDRGLG